MNKVLDGVNIPENYKLYVDNYINESFKMFDEHGYIEEFICDDKNVLNTLRQKLIIEEGYKNTDGILIPLRFYHHGNLDPYTGEKFYMLDDQVFKENGYKVANP